MGKEVFSMDTKAVDLFVNSLKEYPKTMKKYAYRLVNDMAFEFKNQGPGVIDKHDIIRNASFVRRAFDVDKAKTASSVDGIFATAGTYGQDSGKEMFKNFTGWAEQIDPSLKSGRERIIGSKARGGNMAGKVPAKWRMDPSRSIPSAKNFNGPYRPGKKNLSFMAMLHKKQYRGTFILEKTETAKGTYEAGLYAFTNKMEEGWLFPRIMRLQKFGAEPKGKSFDWNEEILELVRKKFTTQTIFDKYILPALEETQKKARK